MRNIYLDMDGTFANLYAVEGWLGYLIEKNPYPYMVAEPMVNMKWLARTIHELQAQGWTVNIISWLSKTSTPLYDELVTQAKLEWLHKRLPSVTFDEIHIAPYGTPKSTFAKGDIKILFDDELNNRNEWQGIAFDEKNLLKSLRNLLDK